MFRGFRFLIFGFVIALLIFGFILFFLVFLIRAFSVLFLFLFRLLLFLRLVLLRFTFLFLLGLFALQITRRGFGIRRIVFRSHVKGEPILSVIDFHPRMRGVTGSD